MTMQGRCLLLGALLAAALLPGTHARANFGMDRYLKAKEGINAEERAMRQRLQDEIKGEDARMRKVADVLAEKPARTHGARLPGAVTHSAVAKPTDARDFKAPPARTAAPKDLAMQRSLARIGAKRRRHLKRLLGFEHQEAASQYGERASPQRAWADSAGAVPRKQKTTSAVALAHRVHRARAAARRQPATASFDISTVRRFDPGQSLSFARELFATFALSYADTSLLTGYVGRDIVQLGHYYAMTRFGCALDCNDVHFNGIDGILGLGMPDAALQSIPTPLVFALSNDRGGLEGQNYVNERAMHQRKFAFLSTAISGELQLGGYDRASTNADMVYVPTTSTTEYSVLVQSLTFGGIELLSWRDKSAPNAIPAILDTGTTCLVIPDTLLGGRVTSKPYSKFYDIMTKGMSFYITIDGHLFEIPFQFWWQKINDAPCVQKTPASYDGILLGDVVFQSLVIEFDLSKPKKPLIGVAPRNPLYKPTPAGQVDALKIPLIKRSSRGVFVQDPKSDKYRHGVDHVPVSMSFARTAFLANISIGSPRQPFTVLLDTGCYLLLCIALSVSHATQELCFVLCSVGPVSVLSGLTY